MKSWFKYEGQWQIWNDNNFILKQGRYPLIYGFFTI